jgi:hypothetical protein
VPDADDFVFDGVEMTAGSLAPGTAPFRALVGFDPDGIAIDGPTAAQRFAVPWGEVRGVWFGLPMSPPSGGRFTPVDVVWVGGSARMLLPGDRMRSVRIAALEARLFSWSPPPPSGPPPMPALRAGRSAEEDSFGPAPVAGAPYGAPPPPPVAPYGPDAVVPAWYRVEHAPLAPRPARRRRRAVLAAGLVLIAAGVGLAVDLAGHHPGSTGAVHLSPPARTPDQQLADRIMLTQGDLPVGWRQDDSASSGGDSSQLRAGQAAITHTFATCMGITDAEATVVFGGQSPDQTAQAASPVFVAPPSAATPGHALEVQTGAAVVKSSTDVARDIAPVSSPRYAGCAATATASELQLGVDAGSGVHDAAGPAVGVVVPLQALPGEHLEALSVTSTVSDRSTRVPVHVELVLVSSGRVEAELQALAIGGTVPDDVFRSSLAAFEQRVVSEGTGVQI